MALQKKEKKKKKKKKQASGCLTVLHAFSKSKITFGLNIFYYFNFTIIIQANTYSTRLGIGTEAKCLLSSSP